MRIRRQYGCVLILIDGTAAGTMVPEARRRLIEIRRADPDALTRSAVYGGGTAVAGAGDDGQPCDAGWWLSTRSRSTSAAQRAKRARGWMASGA